MRCTGYSSAMVSPCPPLLFYFITRVATAAHTVRVHCSNWGERGRRPYASTGELQEIAQEMLSVHGSTLGRAELAQELQQRERSDLPPRGFQPLVAMLSLASRPS